MVLLAPLTDFQTGPRSGQCEDNANFQASRGLFVAHILSQDIGSYDGTSIDRLVFNDNGIIFMHSPMELFCVLMCRHYIA